MPSGTRSARRIAVTGAAGAIGGRLVARLTGLDAVEVVVALDIRPVTPPSPKVSAYRRDITEPAADLLRDHRVDTVVHLAWVLRPGRDREAVRRANVGGTARVLEACAAAGVRNVVFLSSTTVYGAHADNPQALSEDAPVRPVRGFHYAEDKAAAERLLERHRLDHPATTVAVLRGCVVMGPTSANFITEALAKSLLVGVRGEDPRMQFLHEDDLEDALLGFLEAPRDGTYNIAGEGTVRYSDLARTAGRRLLWLPAALVYPVVQATWALRLQNDSPACGVDMVRWSWVASTERLRRETGWRPRYTSREAIESSPIARP